MTEKDPLLVSLPWGHDWRVGWVLGMWLAGWPIPQFRWLRGLGHLRAVVGICWAAWCSAMGRAPTGTVDGHLAGGVVEPALGDGDHGLAAILPPP